MTKNSPTFEQAKKYFRELIRDGWIPIAAYDASVLAFALDKETSDKLRRYTKIYEHQ